MILYRHNRTTDGNGGNSNPKRANRLEFERSEGL